LIDMSNKTSNKVSNLLDAQLDTEPGGREAKRDNVSLVEIVKRVSNDPMFVVWLKRRYSSRGHVNYIITSIKYLLSVLKDPVVLKGLSYRRARGCLEALAAIRDYANLNYTTSIDTSSISRMLRKYMPPRTVSEVTESFLKLELVDKSIVEQALEQLKNIM
jgi:hypothetical protein